MDLNITKLAKLQGNDVKDFMTRIDSKLIMDVKKSQIVENDEWLDMVEFTVPYIEADMVFLVRLFQSFCRL